MPGDLVPYDAVEAHHREIHEDQPREPVADAEAGPDTISLPQLNELVQRNTETFVGFPAHHVGADLVGEWYKRNLRTYANLWRAAEEGDDRVVLLIGQGHVRTLRTFLRENPEFEVVPVDEVL